MFQDLTKVMEQVSKDRGIPKQMLIEAVEAAMLTAARKKYGQVREIEAKFNEEIGEVELFQFRKVVETVTNELTEVDPSDAHKLDPEAQIGDSIGEKLDNKFLGRIAAQTAKQVIVQKVRDAERDVVYNEYKDRVGELITGIVRRVEKGNLIVDLGRTEAMVPVKEQVRSEVFKPNDRIQAYFLTIDRSSRGPQLILSRRAQGLVIKLFEMEVPEISEKIVEIKKAAREPGARCKIAVSSKDHDVDPVGACVGMKGSRVQSVVQELRGEKIDIVCWDNDPAKFVCNAIAPAEVSKVIIREKDHSMEVVVPDDQLALAIGKKGQNVRLAGQLVGWNIDVYSDSKLDEMAKRAKKILVKALGVDDGVSTILYSQAFRTPEEIAESSFQEL
ncbi:MAG: transcription termination factor NusA, partial [Deltaproteobacteria bacterium]|nr:transcription termination factor NusA [Deltaproteobacteria bacterium]